MSRDIDSLNETTIGLVCLIAREITRSKDIYACLRQLVGGRSRPAADQSPTDISDVARAAGLPCRTMISHAAWVHCIANPRCRNARQRAIRIWEILQSLAKALPRPRMPEPALNFHTVFWAGDGRFHFLRLKQVCRRDEDGRPTIVVMLPEEEVSINGSL